MSPHDPSQADKQMRLSRRLSHLQSIQSSLRPTFMNLKEEESKKSHEHFTYCNQLTRTELEAQAYRFHNLMDQHQIRLDRIKELNGLISNTARRLDELKIQIESMNKEMLTGNREIAEIQRTLRSMETFWFTSYRE